MQDGARTRIQGTSEASTISKREDKKVVQEIYPLLFPNKVMAAIDMHSSLRKGSTFLPLDSLRVPALMSIFLQAHLRETWVTDLLNRFAQESSADEPAVEASGKKAFNTSQHQSVVLLRLFCSPEFHHHPLNPPTGPIGGKKPAGYSKDVLGWDEKKITSVASVIEYCVLGFMKNPDVLLWERAVDFVKPVEPLPPIPGMQQSSDASAYQPQPYEDVQYEAEQDADEEEEEVYDDDEQDAVDDDIDADDLDYDETPADDDAGTVPYLYDIFLAGNYESYGSLEGGYEQMPTPFAPTDADVFLNMHGDLNDLPPAYSPMDLPPAYSFNEQADSTIMNEHAARLDELQQQQPAMLAAPEAPFVQQAAADPYVFADKAMQFDEYLNEKGANDRRITFVSGDLPAEGTTLAIVQPLEDAVATQADAASPFNDITLVIPPAYEEGYSYHMNCLDEKHDKKVQRCKHLKNCTCVSDEFFDADDDDSRPAAKRRKSDHEPLDIDKNSNVSPGDMNETAVADIYIVGQSTNAHIAPMICTLAIFFLWHFC